MNHLGTLVGCGFSKFCAIGVFGCWVLGGTSFLLVLGFLLGYGFFIFG